MNARTALLAIALLAAGAPAARAAESDDATLKDDIKVLTELVRDLQRRVSVLEARTAARAPAPAATSAPSVIRPAPAVARDLAGTAQEAHPSAAPAAPIAAARPGATPDYVSPEAMLKASWNQVVAGMGKPAVSALLGSPSSTFHIDGRLVWYYYYPGAGRGSVFFTDAGQVSSYQSPFPGFGW